LNVVLRWGGTLLLLLLLVTAGLDGEEEVSLEEDGGGRTDSRRYAVEVEEGYWLSELDGGDGDGDGEDVVDEDAFVVVDVDRRALLRALPLLPLGEDDDPKPSVFQESFASVLPEEDLAEVDWPYEDEDSVLLGGGGEYPVDEELLEEDCRPPPA
jgi:hypothetical protein